MGEVGEVAALIAGNVIDCLKNKGRRSVLSLLTNSDGNADIYHSILMVTKRTLFEYLQSNDSKSPSVRQNLSSDYIESIVFKSQDDPNYLHEWCPVFFYEDGDCCIAGFLDVKGEFRLYRTNIVYEIFDDGLVFMDKDRNYFRLLDSLCTKTYEKLSRLEGIISVNEFPPIFLSGFENGIPNDWKRIIQETVKILKLNIGNVKPTSASHYDNEKVKSGDNESLPTSNSEVQEREDGSVANPLDECHSTTNSSVQGLDHDSSVNPDESNDSKSAGDENIRREDPNPRRVDFTIDIVNGKVNRTLSAATDDLHVDRLDNGGPLNLTKVLTRTRSGRLVKPPLDTWRGQSIHEVNGRIEVCLGSTVDPVYLRMLGLLPDSGYSSKRKRRAFTQQNTRGKSRKSLDIPRRLAFTSKDLEETDDEDIIQDLLTRVTARRTAASRNDTDNGDEVAAIPPSVSNSDVLNADRVPDMDTDKIEVASSSSNFSHDEAVSEERKNHSLLLSKSKEVGISRSSNAAHLHKRRCHPVYKMSICSPCFLSVSPILVEGSNGTKRRDINNHELRPPLRNQRVVAAQIHQVDDSSLTKDNEKSVLRTPSSSSPLSKIMKVSAYREALSISPIREDDSLSPRATSRSSDISNGEKRKNIENPLESSLFERRRKSTLVEKRKWRRMNVDLDADDSE